MSEVSKSGQSEGNPTPYDLVFGSPFFEDDRFPGIREEAEARDVDPADPERFALLGTVGALLRELLPEDTGGAEFSRHAALVYQAYHYWAGGKLFRDMTEPEVRAQIEGRDTPGRLTLSPPTRSGYLRLPRHLFWARIEEDATPEPVDGFFWMVAPPASDDSPGGSAGVERLELLFVLGLFPGRPGFSTIVLEAELGHEAPRQSGEGEGEREEFENILPGGELQGWYGLVTELEVLTLVALLFALSSGSGSGAGGSGGSGGSDVE